jgi:nucleoid-associated protein YgaU
MGDAGGPACATPSRPGDTLSGIARDELGGTGRWPEIFALNRDVVVNPDRIFPGQVLVLPDA